MQTETLAPPPSPPEPTDEQAVAAVRQGDLNRYRELVERHQRLVFGIAWSRLGDAGLAEDAAQEAFIRGFRYLPMLESGAKFPAWISAIARNVAIAFGLKHRRELKRRERWALEHPTTALPTAMLDEPGSAETLRHALAELPDLHRECLVLFYLEGKSGAETAAALGLEEPALRMRLMRARAALREKLEKKLGDSLEQLRPSRTFVPSVMAAVLATPAGKAGGAGAGATLLSVLGKVLPFKFIPAFFWMISLVPSMLFTAWLGREERRNFRDAEGFRPRLHRIFYRQFLWAFPMLMAGSYAVVYVVQRSWGVQSVMVSLGVLTLALALYSARQYSFVRNRYYFRQLLYVTVMGLTEVAVGAGWLPIIWFSPIMLLATFAWVSVQKDRPLRMDYNLFLRAAQKMLPEASAATVPAAQAFPLSPAGMREFGRFLATRFLTINYRWENDGLKLRVPPLQPTFLNNFKSFFNPFSHSASFLLMQGDGTVKAYCGLRDEAALRSLDPAAPLVRAEVEQQVTAAVNRAWAFFRAGDAVAAEGALGQTPESEIFIVPGAIAPSFRWTKRVMLGFLIITVGLTLWAWSMMGRSRITTRALSPVTASAGQVRAALQDWANGISPPGAPSTSWYGDIYTSYLLPQAELFGPEAFAQVQARLRADSSRGGKATSFGGLSFVEEKAVAQDWLPPAELGATPATVHAYFNALNPANRARMLQLDTSAVKGETYTVLTSELLLWQLRWLRKVESLDLVEAAPIIAQLRASQVLDEKPIAGRRPLKEWKSVNGLFITQGWDPLQDTYQALAMLEMLGGLGQIDREACIQGILRLHQGKGVFGAPMGSDHAVLLIWGDAQDTFCAFESLRILHALDRVKDLAQWKFRPMNTAAARPALEVSSSPGTPPPRALAWDEIEAWVAAQRLDRNLREHAADSLAPYRSLLEP